MKTLQVPVKDPGLYASFKALCAANQTTISAAILAFLRLAVQKQRLPDSPPK